MPYFKIMTRLRSTDMTDRSSVQFQNKALCYLKSTPLRLTHHSAQMILCSGTNASKNSGVILDLWRFHSLTKSQKVFHCFVNRTVLSWSSISVAAVLPDGIKESIQNQPSSASEVDVLMWSKTSITMATLSLQPLLPTGSGLHHGVDRGCDLTHIKILQHKHSHEARAYLALYPYRKKCNTCHPFGSHHLKSASHTEEFYFKT